MYNIRWLTSIASYDKLRILRIYFDPNPHGKILPDGKVCTIHVDYGGSQNLDKVSQIRTKCFDNERQPGILWPKM